MAVELAGYPASHRICESLASNNANTLLQTFADDSLRGRVMGTYSLTVFGLVPLGALAMGTLAARIGEPWTVALGAAALLACVVSLSLCHPALRDLE